MICLYACMYETFYMKWRLFLLAPLLLQPNVQADTQPQQLQSLCHWNMVHASHQTLRHPVVIYKKAHSSEIKRQLLLSLIKENVLQIKERRIIHLNISMVTTNCNLLSRSRRSTQSCSIFNIYTKLKKNLFSFCSIFQRNTLDGLLNLTIPGLDTSDDILSKFPLSNWSLLLFIILKGS